jgi:hypothetical protein
VETKRKRASLGVRAAQVLAYLLTRGDEPFQRYFLSAPRTTIIRWAIRIRSLRRRTLSSGRPRLDDTIVELIVTLKPLAPSGVHLLDPDRGDLLFDLQHMQLPLEVTEELWTVVVDHGNGLARGPPVGTRLLTNGSVVRTQLGEPLFLLGRTSARGA